MWTMRGCYVKKTVRIYTSMMPELIKLVFPLILHSTFDTFSSVTLGGSSGASGDDSLDKI